MGGVYAAGYFLFSLCFGVITFILWIRLALRFFHISTLNHVSQVVYQCTEPVVAPVRQLLSRLNLRQGRYDWACLSVLVVVEVLKFILIAGLFFRGKFPWFLLVSYPIADMIIQSANILMYAILIRVIVSWFNPTWRHPMGDLLIIITEPTLSWIRRYIPDIAGLDFSPFIAFIVIKAVTVFISASMPFHLI